MSAILNVEDVSYAYAKRQALSKVSFSIREGERVALVGPNGAGKTTLFLIAAGVLQGYEGRVTAAGATPGCADGSGEFHSKVGIVFQNTEDQLFNTTVFDDVAFGPLNLGLPKEEVHQRAHEALDSVGLDGSLNDEFPLHLSGGQRRRVALAGVLAMRPALLLLDEPSSDLDPRGRHELIALLQKQEITRMVSTHNLDFAVHTCDRAIVLDAGHLVADGPIREVFADETLMFEHGLEVPYSVRIEKKSGTPPEM